MFTHYRKSFVVIALVVVLGVLAPAASADLGGRHEPKAGLGYPSQAATDAIGAQRVQDARRDQGSTLGWPSQAAADAIRGIRDVQIRDGAHMALIENARRHGLTVQNVKPIGSRQFNVPSPATSSKVTGSGGFGWTYPGVLASLSLAFALLVGGVVLAARRFKSRTVTA